MWIYYIILILMTLLGAVASYFLKKLSESNGLSVILKNINLYFGGGLYFITAVINVYLLKFLDYSLVLPLTSLTYIWTMFISYKFLGEKITKKKIAGTAFILFGAVLIGFS